tara:strand:- start:263 stop:619 length:357 start_codon:yes stop_codon:yes gene_type:complete
MTALLEVAKLQFRDRMGGALKSVEVPEWQVDGKPTVVYFKPAMTFKQQGEVLSLAGQDKQVDAIIMTFIFRALDEEGVPLFKKIHFKEIINELDPDVIAGVVSAMGEETLSIEDAEKN